MVLREEYMEKLFTYLDAPLVKILAGIRRCGKSTILEMFAQALKNRGINEKNIIRRRYTSFEIEDCYTAKDMYNDIKKEMTGGGRYLNKIFRGDGKPLYVAPDFSRTQPKYCQERKK